MRPAFCGTIAGLTTSNACSEKPPLSSSQPPQPETWVDSEISSLLETVERRPVVEVATTERPLPARPERQARLSGPLARAARSGRKAIRDRRFELLLLALGLACAGAIVWLVTLVAGP